MTTDAEKDKVMARIKALLDKAASTEHEGEADAFIAGAGRLMAKHRIEESDLVDESDIITSTLTTTVLWGDLPYPQARGTLIGNVAKPFGVFAYAHLGENGQPGYVSLVGLPESIDLTIRTFLMLQTQIDSVALTAEPMLKVQFGEHWIEFPSLEPVDEYQSSMIIGFAIRVGERLAAGVAEAEAEAEHDGGAGSGMALVLKSDYDKAERKVVEEDGLEFETPSAKLSNAGIVAGAQAAEAADLGQDRIEHTARPVAHYGELNQ